MLIWSASPFCSRCLHRCRSRLPASFAFSSASACRFSAESIALSSISAFTSFSISRHMSSGELSDRFSSGFAGPRFVFA